MNELQLERLDNMVNNPYTWLLFVFVMFLPIVLKFMRRFYPKHWQESMAKEEACTLELHQKPEMKLVRKIINFGFISMLLISYLLSFHLLSDLVNPLETFRNIFFTGFILIVLVTGYYESKINKDKSCKDVIFGYKFIKIVGIIGIIIFVIALIVTVLKEWKVF